MAPRTGLDAGSLIFHKEPVHCYDNHNLHVVLFCFPELDTHKHLVLSKHRTTHHHVERKVGFFHSTPIYACTSQALVSHLDLNQVQTICCTRISRAMEKHTHSDHAAP